MKRSSSVYFLETACLPLDGATITVKTGPIAVTNKVLSDEIMNCYFIIITIWSQQMAYFWNFNCACQNKCSFVRGWGSKHTQKPGFAKSNFQESCLIFNCCNCKTQALFKRTGTNLAPAGGSGERRPPAQLRPVSHLCSSHKLLSSVYFFGVSRCPSAAFLGGVCFFVFLWTGMTDR